MEKSRTTTIFYTASEIIDGQSYERIQPDLDDAFMLGNALVDLQSVFQA